MKRIAFAIVLLVSSFALIGTSYASLVDIGRCGEPTMCDIYNAIYGTNYADNAALAALENVSLTTGGLFTTTGTLSLMARYAGAGLTLQYYDNSGAYNIFSNMPGAQISYNPAVIYTVPANSQFGFRGETYLGEFSSQSSLNSDNKYHFVVLNTPIANTYLIGFEDMSGGSDWDYNDAVFEIDPPSPVVPEPASLSFLGLGLFGLLKLKKKRDV